MSVWMSHEDAVIKLPKTIYNSKIKTFLSIGKNSKKIGIKKINLSEIK